MPIKRILVLVLPVMLLALGGCGPSPGVSTGEVALLVTRDFGEEEIFNDIIELEPKKTVLELLNEHLDVETAYGGGFVNAINGLESGYTNAAEREQFDWFYFINGIMTSAGAAEYLPTNEDIIWWDYHSWGDIPFTPAVIGAFPQPFVNGYRNNNPGTLILAGDGCGDLADKFAGYLEKVSVRELDVKPYEEKPAFDRTKITVVIALWEELKESNFWAGVQENRDKTGWFAELDEDAFYGLNEKAQRQASYHERVGAILATGMGMGDGTPLWLITGLDKQGITDAVEVLVGSQKKLEMLFGALVHDKQVIPLPLQKR